MKNPTINGVEFEVEVDFDNDKRIERLCIFLPGSDVELTDVLSDKVVKEIEELAYESYEPPQPEREQWEDR